MQSRASETTTNGTVTIKPALFVWEFVFHQRRLTIADIGRFSAFEILTGSLSHTPTHTRTCIKGQAHRRCPPARTYHSGSQQSLLRILQHGHWSGIGDDNRHFCRVAALRYVSSVKADLLCPELNYLSSRATTGGFTVLFGGTLYYLFGKRKVPNNGIISTVLIIMYLLAVGVRFSHLTSNSSLW